ncbi:hypothetical protein BM43_7559 (plasmid) [Burkholderia gladioli]|uniref:Bacterial shufflon protein N-terminal domain-containing protein n=1 Tax=Burkholderia gladioli TaxID=28095 RepID=A0AAW3FCQ0_BURGA|nr:shufflon system plasmid conjugative transfer pilus tip adhesin PilV [Burkholderia gladioli]AJW93658.1 hypothetical protein BM43_7559 [Burkholderia gladioli]AWY53043.1 shufflon system plasmid conjugative transfer pilus tip adhesin PilV [Burkholderia gladioli pv. gladioli]KGC24032.1 hypothetical protein DM48_8028 [Burkholderia gladioli]
MSSFFGGLFAMLISVTAMAGLYAWSKIGFANVQAAVIANQGVLIGQAMNKYLSDTSTALAQIATPTAPATVTVDQLAQAGYLPKSVSMRNAYGQDWQMQVLQPVPGQLQALLFTTGGRQIPPSVLVPSAAQTSAQGMLGGFVPYANQFGDTSMQPTVAVGANGTFRQSLEGYGNPGSGHLAAMLGMANAQADNGFLYRVDMKPSRPDLNSMQTDLGMTDAAGNKHDITGAGTVNAVAGRFSGNIGTAGFDPQSGLPAGYAGGVHTWDVYAEGTIAAGNQGKLNASMDYQGHIVGQLLSLANASVPNTACTNYGVNVTSVSANADGSGQMLSCQLTDQGPRWLPIGGRWLRYGYYTVADSWSVPAPSCPNGGAMKIQVTLQNFSVNDTTVVNSGPATWNGNGWTVHLTDGSGNAIPGAQGIAATYCAY